MDSKYNIYIIGEKNSGKTSFLNKYKESNDKLINDETYIIQVDEEQNLQVQMKVVHLEDDISEANGLIMLYDISDKTSFLKLKEWFDKHIGVKFPCILVAMKCDKVNEDNLVNVLLGQNYATMMQMPFYTCSYPSGRNIADSVIAMAELIYDELDFYDPVKPFVNKRELVILGDSNTGKTSLLDWFSNKDFKEKFVPTVLANKTEFDATIGKETIKVQITEIAGSGGYEERMMQIIKNKCDGLILMYDCTNNDSFNNVTSWLNLFKKTVNKDVPMVLVANKKDLVKNDEYCEGNIFAEQNNMDYVEISVKHRDNLESIIMNLI